jgi:hypothetical protein
LNVLCVNREIKVNFHCCDIFLPNILHISACLLIYSSIYTYPVTYSGVVLLFGDLLP